MKAATVKKSNYGANVQRRRECKTLPSVLAEQIEVYRLRYQPVRWSKIYLKNSQSSQYSC
jgi:hypothetical protein